MNMRIQGFTGVYVAIYGMYYNPGDYMVGEYMPLSDFYMLFVSLMSDDCIQVACDLDETELCLCG